MGISLESTARAVMASAAFATAAIATGPAGATTWLLDQYNISGPTPVGQVQVTDNGAGVLTFNVTLNGGYQFLGGASAFGFNLDGDPTISYSATSSNFVSGDTTSSPKNMDGWGKFEYQVTLNGSGGSNLQGQSLTFKITGAGLDIGDLQFNDSSLLFSADVCNAGATAESCGSVATGFAAGGPELPPGANSPVPLPPAAVLFVSALVGLAGLRRRRRRVVAA